MSAGTGVARAPEQVHADAAAAAVDAAIRAELIAKALAGAYAVPAAPRRRLWLVPGGAR